MITKDTDHESIELKIITQNKIAHHINLIIFNFTLYPGYTRCSVSQRPNETLHVEQRNLMPRFVILPEQ